MRTKMSGNEQKTKEKDKRKEIKRVYKKKWILQNKM